MQGMTKKWLDPPKTISSLSVIERILHARGLEDKKAQISFLESRLSSLNKPESIPGVVDAARILKTAIESKSRILIFGDYDADGITASAVLFHVINTATNQADISIHIPDRVNEGYGLRANAIQQFKEQGVDLILTVDCGITAIEAAEKAKEYDIDLIITDHHQFREDGLLPECAAIAHPCIHGNKGEPLAGVGVAYMLAWAFAREWSGGEKVTKELERILLNLLPLAAIGTVADMVPLQGDNRIIAKWGTNMLKDSVIDGIQAILDEMNLKTHLKASDISFKIAPLLNAVGRLKHAGPAVDLLTTLQGPLASSVASELASINRKRQVIQKAMFSEVQQAVELQQLNKKPIVILKNSEWERGVVGVAAGKCVEYYYRPTVLFVDDGVKLIGSARSISGFSILDALKSCSEFLDEFGGHDMAAGVTLSRNHFDSFVQAMEKYAEQYLDIDSLVPTVSPDIDLTVEECKGIEVAEFLKLLPFGVGNKTPVATIRNVHVDEVKRFGSQGAHLSLKIGSSRSRIRCIWWGNGDKIEVLKRGALISVVGKLGVNDFNGYQTIEMNLEDLSLPCP